MTDLISIFIFTPIQYIGFWPTVGIYAALFLIGFHYLLMPSRAELLRTIRRQTDAKEPGDDDIGFDWTRRRAIALVLLIIGILAAVPLAQVYATMVQAGVYIPSQGGSNLVQCQDLTNVGCWSSGNSGASTLTSCPASPASPCLTQFRRGFYSCNVQAGGTNCVATVTFSPAYSVKPVSWAIFNGTPPAPVHTYTTGGATPIGTTLVFQATNATTWSIPLANTELNGKPDQRLVWTTPATYTSQSGYLCVTSILTSSFPIYTVQSSTDQVTWTNIGTDGFSISPGQDFECSVAETTTLAANTRYFFRVMANDAAAPENTVLGTIEIVLSGLGNAATTTAITVACFASIFSVSPTILQPKVSCSTAIDSQTTFNGNWYAGIPT